MDFEKELYDLCVDMITILHNLKTNDEISETEYNSHMEQKVKIISMFSSR